MENTKIHYIEIIKVNLEKLTEEQLYKTLTLIKNTIDNPKVENKGYKPTKNSSLLSGVEVNYLAWTSIGMLDKASAVKAELASGGFTEGHGIISVEGKPIVMYPSKFTCPRSTFISFCVPNKIDMMIEIYPIDSEIFIYNLTKRKVNCKLTSSVVYKHLEDLLREIENNKN